MSKNHKKIFEKNKSWADQHIHLIKNVVRKVAGDIINFQVASSEKDMLEATDYLIKVGGGDIACRLRRSEMWEKYGKNPKSDGITFRAFVPSGADTELDKLIEGCADWYLYAWLDAENKGFSKWVFFDLEKLRNDDFFKKLKDEKNFIKNKDGTGFAHTSMRKIRNLGAMIKEKPKKSASRKNGDVLEY